MQQQTQYELYQHKWHLVTVEEIGLSEPVVGRLIEAGIETVADLLATTKLRLSRIYWFGAKAQAEVDEALERLGLPPMPARQPRKTLTRRM